MSGICGCITFTGEGPAPKTTPAMTEAAPHRGPDGIRSWTSDDAQLAHLALNVTAEDARETQPLVEDGLVLVADARIDNRTALRRMLSRELRSARPTDADLILAAYRRWGSECPSHLLGDFAFAIWDEEASRLFAARDPMGMRSLYYRTEDRRLLFATEVKQILAAPGVPTQLNKEMIAAYLAANFKDLEHTFYEGIRSLRPAHALLATRADLRRWQYWDLDPESRIEHGGLREYVEHFRELFRKAVRARLRSRKPVGLLLSGGLDSSSIAAMSGWLREKDGSNLAPLRTYSWAFDTLAECDERFISDHIVGRYDFVSTSIDAEAPSLLKKNPYRGPDHDAPHVEGFYGVVDHTYQRARADGVRRMLSGHRGDLVTGQWIFAYLSLFRTGRWRKLWQEFRAYSEHTGVPIWTTARIFLFSPLRANLWPKGQAEWIRTPLRRLYRLIKPPTPHSPFPPWVRPDATEDIHLPTSPSTPAQLTDARQQRYEALFLPFHMRVARMTERHSARRGLKAADPWSDRRLVEFAFAVPPPVLCRNGQNKWIVREAMRGRMPEPARTQAQKVNPYPLHERALIEDPKPLTENLTLEWDGPGFVDPSRLRTYYERFRSGKATDNRFWYTLTLGLWLGEYHL